MLSTNHPDDERLSALAAHDDDATADADLVAHVDGCARCADLVAELGVLRASLAGLPDVAPSRPLRLLPSVEPERPGAGDRLGGWVRRFFAPAMTAGVALAMVGLVGTAAPALQGMAGGQDAAFEQVVPDEQQPDAGAGDGAEAGREQPASEPAAGEQRVLSGSDTPAAYEEGTDDFDAFGSPDPLTAEPPDGGATEPASLPAERSPWPMVLFTGVALVIGAALLRWILVPRAG